MNSKTAPVSEKYHRMADWPNTHISETWDDVDKKLLLAHENDLKLCIIFLLALESVLGTHIIHSTFYWRDLFGRRDLELWSFSTFVCF